MPKDVAKKLQKCELAIWPRHSLLGMKWHDKVDIYILYSKHRDVDVMKIGNKRGRRRQNKTHECRIKFS